MATLLIAAYAVKGHPLREDERQYLDLARSIVKGQGYQLSGHPTAFRVPAWPLVLAVGAVLRLPTAVLAVVPVLCLAAAALLAGAVARSIAGRTAGRLATAGMLLYPLNVFTATTFYPQMFATALFLAMALLVARHRGTNSPIRSSALIGFVGALLCLAVPTMLVPALLGVAATFIGHERRARLVTVAALAFLLPMGVWGARNALTLGSPVPSTTSTGVNLLLGNNEAATPTSGTVLNITRYQTTAQQRGLDEVATDTYYRQTAERWVRQHPAAALRLYLGKMINYFAPYNTSLTGSQNGPLQAVVAYGSFLLLALLAGYRLARFRRRALAPVEKFLWLSFAVSGPYMALAFTRVRFRQPLDSVLIISGAVAAAVWLLPWIAERRRRKVRAS